MAGSQDLINFDVIESQKENIQSLPGGRSAKKLVELYSPPSSTGAVGPLSGSKQLAPLLTPTPNPADTKTLHDTIRKGFEAELAGLAESESDDPLDVYDRYVHWTLDAYPSAQATPQSQLHTLLERATKAFVGAAQYRNDPRYLRLWLHYIHFFSDAPREAYVYLARHGIGESLALFYEEYAAWLEGAGRWAQADEVYRLGLERGARPPARLMRKYGEFEQRREAAGVARDDAPPSPALPTVRPALAAKVDPFASAAAAALRDPQEAQRQQEQQQRQRQQQASRATGKPKMAIFSDADAAPPSAPALSATTKGWDSIGSLAERKKENTVIAKPWAGEKLHAGGKKPVAKMQVFKDATLAKSHITIHPSQYQVTVNPANGKKERVFVDLRAVYPTPEEPGTERSFEEIWAAQRGLLDCCWKREEEEAFGEQPELAMKQAEAMDILADAVSTKLVVHRDEVMLDENGAIVKSQDRENRPRKKKMMEMNVTQIIKTKLDSPSGRKLKKRHSSFASEPTMTMHTRAATDDIYEIFNQPVRRQPGINEEDDDDDASEDDYETDGDYTSGAESTGTAAGTSRRISTGEADGDVADEDDDIDAVHADAVADDAAAVDNVADDAVHADAVADDAAAVDNVADDASVFNDSARFGHEQDLNVAPGALPAAAVPMHIPDLLGDHGSPVYQTAERSTSWTAAGETSTDNAMTSDRDDDDEVFSPLSVRGLSLSFSHKEGVNRGEVDYDAPSLPSSPLQSPVKEDARQEESEAMLSEPRTRTVFIPIPPEDYVAPTRPYRDPAEVANNRLPFMTPITERTESSLAFDSEDNRQRALNAKTPSKAFGSRNMPLLDADEDIVEEEEEEEADAAQEEIVSNEDELEDDEQISSGSVGPEPMSSPLIDIVDENDLPQPPPIKLSQPVFRPKGKVTATATSSAKAANLSPKGPIIKETQCNPVDESIRSEILANLQPALGSYPGFYDHRSEKCEKGAEIRRYAKAVSNRSKAGSNGGGGGGGGGSSGSNRCDRSSGAGLPVVIRFPDSETQYTLRRELGAGAFAPVYLVENMKPDKDEDTEEEGSTAVAQMGRGAFGSAHVRRHAFEALKMETPPSAWEFYMMRLVHARLGPQHRATASLAPALECHLYRDETFLFLPYYPHGTVLDVVNLFRAEPSGVMDETLAMFFAVELFRTVEALHAKNIMHGDIKADNCLLRLEDPLQQQQQQQQMRASDSLSSEQLSSQWQADGSGGWSARGVTLIDFGRAIDMRAFPADVRFVADWKTTAQDCAEMREGRPWTWQLDYHGLAGVLHCLLFGKYMETVRCDGPGTGPAGLTERGPVRRYRMRETLKRYWQTGLWADVFELLLNPTATVQGGAGSDGGTIAHPEDGGRLPALRTMRAVRERMEAWLAANSERGVGLKSLMIKVEGWARGLK